MIYFKYKSRNYYMSNNKYKCMSIFQLCKNKDIYTCFMYINAKNSLGNNYILTRYDNIGHHTDTIREKLLKHNKNKIWYDTIRKITWTWHKYMIMSKFIKLFKYDMIQKKTQKNINIQIIKYNSNL